MAEDDLDVSFESEDNASHPSENESELGDLDVAKAKLKKLKIELEKIKKERQEYLDGWQRCKADSVNLRREADARAARSAEALREELIHDLLPALDSFDIAAESDTWAEVSDGFRSGMEHVRNQLIEALKRHGIERFGKVGDTLDHALHEVAEIRDDAPGEPETVVRILRHGYRTKHRVLRPAHVVLKSSRD